MKKLFYIDYNVIETKTIPKKYWLEADDVEAAELYMNNAAISSAVDTRGYKRELQDFDILETSFQYKTTLWHDVEETYFKLLLRRADEPDPEDKEGLLEDALFYKELANILHINEYDKAYGLFVNADTVLREGTPDRVKELFKVLYNG